MKALITIALLTLTAFTNVSSDYCEGFDDGWDSYYDSKFEIPPVSPACPVLSVYEKDTYEGGYTRGVLAAINNDNN